MAKGSAFSRVLNYFRNADSAEGQACLDASSEIMKTRTAKPVVRRTRKSKQTAQANTQAAAAGASE